MILIPHNSAVISPELLARERIIQSGLNTFYAVGIALSEIKSQQLFLATHATWDDYCRERWGMASRTAYQAIKSASVVAGLISSGIETLPQTESVARELVTVPQSERKTAWLEAIAECPDITADQLKRWLRSKYHIKEVLTKAEHVQRCPQCSHEFAMQSLASKSRGNRLPSKTPDLFRSLFGIFNSAIDYGCGRMRNAMAIEQVANQVLFVDLPEQVDRVHHGGRNVKPVPTNEMADVVFLIQVAHVQPDKVAASRVIQQASLSAIQYLVIDYPAGQFNHAKEGSGYLRLNDAIIADALPNWQIITSKWSGKVNKMVVLHKCALSPLTPPHKKASIP
jgi:hypothetical protein